MSIHRLNTVDAAQMTEKLNDGIKDYSSEIKVMSAARTAFAKFDGKEVSKRFETALKTACPGYTIHLEKGSHLINHRLYVWGNGIEYNNRASITIDNSTLFSYDKFCIEIDQDIARRNVWIQQAEAGLLETKRLCALWNERLSSLKQINEEMNKLGIYPN